MFGDTTLTRLAFTFDLVLYSIRHNILNHTYKWNRDRQIETHLKLNITILKFCSNIKINLQTRKKFKAGLLFFWQAGEKSIFVLKGNISFMRGKSSSNFLAGEMLKCGVKVAKSKKFYTYHPSRDQFHQQIHFCACALSLLEFSYFNNHFWV